MDQQLENLVSRISAGRGIQSVATSFKQRIDQYMNGLFRGKADVRKAIYDALAKAQTGVEAKKISEAQQSLVDADGKFNDAWNSAKWWWRLCFAYGFVHHIASVVSGVAASLLLIEFSQMFAALVPLHVCIFGVAGAMLRSLFYLGYQANRRLLRAVWIARSFSGPFIAALLAVGMYVALKAGLVLVSSEGVESNPNAYVVGFVCMGTGLFWEEAMEKLKGAFAKIRIKN